MNHQARLRRLRGRLAGQALLLTEGPDVQYLCGFTGSNGILLVLPRSTVLLTDGRYTAQAREQTEAAKVRVVISKQLLREACAVLLRAGVAGVGYDSSRMTVAMLERLEASLPASYGPASYGKAARRRFFRRRPASPVAALREIKDEDELRAMEQAALLGCRVFDAVLPQLAARGATLTERDVAAEIEYAARRLGADGMSFETIVASGPRSALPHGLASGERLPRRGFLTMDFGVILRGYCSDMTRTVYLGSPTREERAAYQAVLKAEQAGVAAVRAGVPAAAVDRAARGILRREGWARYFTHSTGHGVGLEIHESPRLGAKVPGAGDVLLAEGMVVTVEPGVYLPGRFGIRIEDMVVVEAGGGRVLTPTPRELLTL